MREEQIADVVACHGTPLFLYDAHIMRDAAARLKQMIPPDGIIFYALKANPTPGIVQLFAGLGLGAEVASGGELNLALACGIAPERIVFSGPAKTERELEAAAVAGIHAIQAESWRELETLQRVCERRGLQARVALRVNLGPLGKGERRSGWAGVSPFGMDDEALRHVRLHAPRLDRIRIVGLHHHQSSQSAYGTRLVERFAAFAELAAGLRRQLELEFVNFGGGYGAPFYADDAPFDLAPVREFFALLASGQGPFGEWRPTIMIESGRFLTGPAGYYIARVVDVKRSFGVRFGLLDGGIHHVLGLSGILRSLRRPVSVRRLGSPSEVALEPIDLAGPLCTPIDRLANAVELPSDLSPGDLLVFANCGAYAKHASPLTFLGHDWPAEVLVNDGRATLLEPRMSCAELRGLPPQPSPGSGGEPLCR